MEQLREHTLGQTVIALSDLGIVELDGKWQGTLDHLLNFLPISFQCVCV